MVYTSMGDVIDRQKYRFGLLHCCPACDTSYNSADDSLCQLLEARWHVSAPLLPTSRGSRLVVGARAAVDIITAPPPVIRDPASLKPEYPSHASMKKVVKGLEDWVKAHIGNGTDQFK